MNKLCIVPLLLLSTIVLQAQTKLFPLLKTSGPVFDAPYAEENKHIAPTVPLGTEMFVAKHKFLESSRRDDILNNVK